jgi:hypothetical protein
MSFLLKPEFITSRTSNGNVQISLSMVILAFGSRAAVPGRLCVCQNTTVGRENTARTAAAPALSVPLHANVTH